ncbi:MAG: carbohydrate-binding protein [Planctomycetota bacterium]|jgi:hypothetical protein
MMAFLCLVFVAGCGKNNFLNEYSGVPFADSSHERGPHTIPGKVQCEYYDLGGEGTAYHDSDGINSGSGNLNPADGSYLNEFRINEAVDISYTKDGGVDDTKYNWVQPRMKQLYVGWTEPGEWLNYTVDVQQSGRYFVGLAYTANDDGQISLSVDNQDVTGPLDIPSTYHAGDKEAWRQWHHWNYLNNLTQIELKEGAHVLTLHTVSNGNMNYDFLEFTLID